MWKRECFASSEFSNPICFEWWLTPWPPKQTKRKIGLFFAMNSMNILLIALESQLSCFYEGLSLTKLYSSLIPRPLAIFKISSLSFLTASRSDRFSHPSYNLSLPYSSQKLSQQILIISTASSSFVYEDFTYLEACFFISSALALISSFSICSSCFSFSCLALSLFYSLVSIFWQTWLI